MSTTIWRIAPPRLAGDDVARLDDFGVPWSGGALFEGDPVECPTCDVGTLEPRRRTTPAPYEWVRGQPQRLPDMAWPIHSFPLVDRSVAEQLAARFNGLEFVPTSWAPHTGAPGVKPSKLRLDAGFLEACASRVELRVTASVNLDPVRSSIEQRTPVCPTCSTRRWTFQANARNDDPEARTGITCVTGTEHYERTWKGRRSEVTHQPRSEAGGLQVRRAELHGASVFVPHLEGSRTDPEPTAMLCTDDVRRFMTEELALSYVLFLEVGSVVP